MEDHADAEHPHSPPETALGIPFRGRSPMNVRIERDGHLARVVMDRPEAMNAISSQFATELLAAWESLRDDRDIWVAILRSSGERAFCVGADLKERKTLDMDAWRDQRA